MSATIQESHDLAVELAARAEQATSQQERARLEDEAFQALPRNMRLKDPTSSLVAAFGWSHHEVRHRRDLLLAGEAAAPLWGLVEGGLAWSPAVVMLRQARAAVHSGISDLETAILREVAMYRSAGRQTRGPNGRVFRKKAQVARTPSKRGTKGYSERIFALFDAYLADTVGEDAPLYEDICASARVQIREVLADVERDAKKARTRYAAFREVKLSRRRMERDALLNACRTLYLEEPKPGHFPDLSEVRARKRELAKKYHPDMHGGDEATRPAYEAVMQACKTIEDQIEAASSRLHPEENEAAHGHG